MHSVLDFVTKHGYSVLFGALFLHQLGLPVPGPLFLIAAGALAAAGKMGLVVALVLAVIACVLADWPWYEAGRRRATGFYISYTVLRETPTPTTEGPRRRLPVWAFHSPYRQVRPGARRGNASPGWDIWSPAASSSWASMGWAPDSIRAPMLDSVTC